MRRRDRRLMAAVSLSRTIPFRAVSSGRTEKGIGRTSVLRPFRSLLYSPTLPLPLSPTPRESYVGPLGPLRLKATWMHIVRGILLAMRSLPTTLLATDPTPHEAPDIRAWWNRVDAELADCAPFERAVLAGMRTDRLGYAFVGGYESALRRMLPDLPGGKTAALCVTEEGGGHPRAIRSTLRPEGDGWRLDGSKKFITLGTEADLLLVAASVGEDGEGRNRLRMALIPRDADGVTLAPMPELPFVPEIPHAEVRFENVRVGEGELLPGDGYARYVKPFRTFEDIHVNAGILGYLLGVARRSGWPPEAIERLIALTMLLGELGAGDASDPGVHVALGGYFTLFREALAAVEPHWELAPEDVRNGWHRDVALFQVAGKARAQRLATAWQRFSTPAPEGGR